REYRLVCGRTCRHREFATNIKFATKMMIPILLRNAGNRRGWTLLATVAVALATIAARAEQVVIPDSTLGRSVPRVAQVPRPPRRAPESADQGATSGWRAARDAEHGAAIRPTYSDQFTAGVQQAEPATEVGDVPAAEQAGESTFEPSEGVVRSGRDGGDASRVTRGEGPGEASEEIVVPARMAALEQRLEQVVAFHYNRPLNSREDSPGSV